MVLTFILFVIGFFILVKGADLLVDGASSLAKKFGVSSLFIGLTVVAFGTSAPELAVNLFASVKGESDIAIGNIIGSNIANILLILGISAAIFPLALSRGTVWKEIPLSFLAVLIVLFMANDALIDGVDFSLLTRIDGLVLLAFFSIFLYYSFGVSKLVAQDGERVARYSLPKSILMIFVGLAGLVVGGKWIVDGAVAIAHMFDVSEALIGLTIVAVGTSLPELATSAIAAFKKHSDLAVGNIVGSNIFNIFFVLGISAFVRPLPFSPVLLFDVYVAIFATFLLFFAMFIGAKNVLERWQGVTCVVLYVSYVAYLIARG